MLKQKVNYAWRMAATGLSFSTFGVGGVIIGSIIAPIVKCVSKDADRQQQLTQRTIKYSFKGFVEMMCKLGIMSYDVQGLEKLQHSQGELIIANHPTLIDVVMLIAFLPQANCVVKQSLWSNPFTKGPVRSAGYILNLGSQTFIEACVEKFRHKDAASLVIFPEGTRTEKQQQLNPFQRGAANIALRADVAIRPVVIRCTPSTLTKNEKWYHIPDRPFHIEMRVLDSMQVSDIMACRDVNPKNVRKLNAWLYDFFDKELSK
ncbi:1-acyl-sn-glycerol-3-phosphate acyltransferase [Acinetobacter qingfengensis]|nr:lysophospholipid acyltransferase family protein [Acinetobacter qingfengensis]KAA8733849.1 1-acyl-sn-glycerol-3-phosphate acyltransferase [Acinetobacter qingfengensis]